ncbi:nitrite/sulfite reductase [Thermocladium modestius]|uniref:nitrite/sulfite reductase n=1 Tax=Thermocladium modestius TaxID=62609 RepID=UPI0016644D94|nr:nitrite/sulfite reductase [Thermocladium modestius]
MGGEAVKYSDVYKVVYPRKHEGIYKNRGDNAWVSVRIRQGPGRDPSKWYSSQLRTVTHVADRYGDGRIMLGTRGDVEVVAVDYRMFDEVVAQLRMAGLEPRDSCGSSVRNPIPCPSNHCPLALANAEALSTFIGDYFRGRAEYEGVNMPHRLKISVSGCGEACAVPASQDVGIIARGDGGFDVYLGGGVGEHAFTAKPAFTGVAADDLLPICIGVAQVLKREGERKGFKWVVKNRGLDAVRSEVIKAAEEVKRQGVPSPPPSGPVFLGNLMVRLHYPAGWVSSSELESVARLAEERGVGYVVLFNDQTIYVPLAGSTMEMKGERLGPYRGGKAATVACLGKELCPPGLIDTTSLGRRIHVHLRRPVKVGVSGCTHDCAMSRTSDIGLEPFGFNARIIVTIGGGARRVGEAVGVVELSDAEAVVDALLDMMDEADADDAGELMERVGVESIKARLSARIKSFKPWDNGLQSTLGPD